MLVKRRQKEVRTEEKLSQLQYFLPQTLLHSMFVKLIDDIFRLF